MSEWADVGPVAEVRRRRKVVIPAGDAATGEAPDTVLVLAVDDGFRAFGNVCVHRRKLLERGYEAGVIPKRVVPEFIP